MQVLVVGNNPQTDARLSHALRAAGFDSTWLHNVNHQETLDQLAKLDAGVLVLVCPPGACTGACLVRQLRQLGSELLILVVAVRGSAGRWTGCHQAGADDYIEAERDLPALPARIKALIRRTSASSASPRETTLATLLRVSDLVLDLRTRRARRRDRVIELAPLDYALLEYLMRHEGKLCERKTLVEHAWEQPYNRNSNRLDLAMGRLRRKIDDPASDIRLIHTVQGNGYKLTAET